METLIAQNSPNPLLDLSKSANWELTCLDNNNQVLESVNAKLFLGDFPRPESVTIILPTVSSLNNRQVTINLNTNDYKGAIIVEPQGGDFINGVLSLTVAYQKNTILPIISNSSNGWIMPVLQTQ